jgi:hypothetical protein
LWKALRRQFVFSPQAQKEYCIQAFKDQHIDWHDVYAVPDFLSFFEPYVNATFDRYCRRAEDIDWTQLQFIIEACDGGVRTRYRMYSRDEVIELWNKDSFMAIEGRELPSQIANALTNYIPVNVKITTYPELDEEQYSLLQQNPDGTWKIPYGSIPPQKFKAESSPIELITGRVSKAKGPWKQIKDVLKYVRRDWAYLFPVGIIDWGHFYEHDYPKEQDVTEFVRNHPDKYHVPFANLFATSAVSERITECNNAISYSDRSSFIQARSNPSVRFNGRGNVQPRTIIGHTEIGLASDVPRRTRQDMAQVHNENLVSEQQARRTAPRRVRIPTCIEDLTKDQLKSELNRRNVRFNSNLKKPELVALLHSLPGMELRENQQALIDNIVGNEISSDQQTAPDLPSDIIPSAQQNIRSNDSMLDTLARLEVLLNQYGIAAPTR